MGVRETASRARAGGRETNDDRQGTIRSLRHPVNEQEWLSIAGYRVSLQLALASACPAQVCDDAGLMSAPLSSSPMLVACLCAEWCGSCRDYRETFDAVAAAFPEMRFVWVDIEDEAELVDPVEVENFPTLLIASAARANFFGPLTPHKETLLRLLRTEAEPGAKARLIDPQVQALAQRLRARED